MHIHCRHQHGVEALRLYAELKTTVNMTTWLLRCGPIGAPVRPYDVQHLSLNKLNEVESFLEDLVSAKLPRPTGY